MNRFLLGVLIAASISLIVFAAIAANALPALIFGVVVVGLISIGLATVGVNLFSRFTDAQHKMKSLQFDHIERMASKGFLPAGAPYLPARAQLAAPESSSSPSTSAERGIQFDSSDPRALAINLLLYTCNLGRDKSNLIATAQECAGANMPGYSVRKRDYAVKYLQDKYGVVTVPGGVQNGGGTFVPEGIGTVRGLYDRVLTDSAVDALPARVR